MKRLVVIPLLCVALSLMGQDDCTALFKSVTEKVKLNRKLAAKGFDLSATIEVITDNSGSFTENITVRIRGEKYYYSTNTLQLFQDDKTMVVVNTDAGTVYLTRPLPSAYRENKFEQLFQMQDSVMRHFRISSCQKEFGTLTKGVGYFKIVLSPTPEMKQAGIDGILYWIAAETRDVKKVSIQYSSSSGSSLRRYDMTINKMTVGNKPVPFEGSALSMVMNGKEIRQSYEKYELIDKRN